MNETLQIRIHGHNGLPTLVYLPGLHGDWTLASSFRAAVRDKVRLVEFTYPRTLSWTLSDYARAIEESLLRHGICSGWLLGESFGSQIIWPLFSEPAALNTAPGNATIPGGDKNAKSCPRFQAQGIILVGGFARHPTIWGVRLAQFISRAKPRWLSRFALFIYAKYARIRHAKAPETLANISEFVARRTALDGKAMHHRLGLIANSDPREVIRSIKCPIYHLSGFVDPIVPWMPAQHWFRKNCPACRATKLIYSADHNVLGTAPQKAADCILRWIH